MKFALASDLHLDFGGIEKLPTKVDGVDTLVLAGDTIEVDVLKKSSGLQKRAIGYFQELNRNFSTVIYIVGNHEHYNNSFFYTVPNLRTQFAKAGLNNFVVLDNSTIEVEDAIFFGTTMWTTCRGRNPLIMNAVQSGMNDYHLIHTAKLAYEGTVNLTVAETVTQCEIAKKKIAEFGFMVTDKKKVLLTHMAPTFLSIPEKCKRSPLNDAYYEDISEILLDSNIMVACHGHIHENAYYTVGNTLVVANPRGYYGSEPEADNFEFQVVNI